MSKPAKIACFVGGIYYFLVGVLLFFAPSFFFHKVAPIGSYNEHYAIDLGSFLLPLGLFLLLAARYTKWSQPVIGLAALASLLHLVSHLREGPHSARAILGGVFFLLIVLVLATPLVIGRKSTNE
jgi:hypothetical protein